MKNQQCGKPARYEAGYCNYPMCDCDLSEGHPDSAVMLQRSTDAAEIARLRAALEWLLPRQAAPGCIDVIMDALRLQ